MEYGFLLLTVASPLLLAYLAHRKHQAKCGEVWHTLLSDLVKHPDKVQRAAMPLLDAARRGMLPTYLKSMSNELDALVGDLVEVALTRDTSRLAFVKQVLEVPGNSLSIPTFCCLMCIAHLRLFPL